MSKGTSKKWRQHSLRKTKELRVLVGRHVLACGGRALNDASWVIATRYGRLRLLVPVDASGTYVVVGAFETPGLVPEAGAPASGGRLTLDGAPGYSHALGACRDRSAEDAFAEWKLSIEAMLLDEVEAGELAALLEERLEPDEVAALVRHLRAPSATVALRAALDPPHLGHDAA